MNNNVNLLRPNRALEPHIPTISSFSTRLHAIHLIYTSGVSQVFMSWSPAPHGMADLHLYPAAPQKRLLSPTPGVGV